MPPLLTFTIFQNSEYNLFTVHPEETMNEYLSGGSAIFLSEVQTVLLIVPRSIVMTRICGYQYPKLSAKVQILWILVPFLLVLIQSYHPLIWDDLVKTHLTVGDIFC